MLLEMASISIGALVPLLAAIAVVVTLRATWAHWAAEPADEEPRAVPRTFGGTSDFASARTSSTTQPMRADEQWRRLSRVFHTAIARSTLIGDCHRRAAVHLGVAELALDHLKDELAVLLTLSPSPQFAAAVLGPSAPRADESPRRTPSRLAA